MKTEIETERLTPVKYVEAVESKLGKRLTGKECIASYQRWLRGVSVDDAVAEMQGRESGTDAELRAYIDSAQSALTRLLTVEEIGDLTGFWKAGASVEEALANLGKATIFEAIPDGECQGGCGADLNDANGDEDGYCRHCARLLAKERES